MIEVTDKDRSIAGFVAHIVAAHNGKTSGQLENYIARVQMMATEKATKEARELIKEMREVIEAYAHGMKYDMNAIRVKADALLERSKEFA